MLQGDATLTREMLRQVADRYGTPCFVYSFDDIIARVGALRQAFGDRFKISYAMKSNPNPVLLGRLRDHVDTIDISSGGELRRALQCGWPADKLSFTGPAKVGWELAAAVDSEIGEVIVESVDEATELNAIAEAKGRRANILVRLSPSRMPKGFGVNMAQKPTQFGVDEEDLAAALAAVMALKNLDCRGFHIYSGTQCLHADAIAQNYEIFVDLFRRAAAATGIRPAKLIFGSGLGIPYHEENVPLDLDALATAANPILDALRGEAVFASSELILETGRYLVGEAGFYLTSVVRIKHSRNSWIALCDGGMNHHLGACGHLGSIIHRNYQMFPLTPGTGEERAYNLTGPLCTTIDTLGHGVTFPELSKGDVIVVRCSGAYGATASPIHFISQPPPREILLEQSDGTPLLQDISQFDVAADAPMS